MVKKFISVILVVFLGVLIISCGDDNSDDEKNETPDDGNGVVHYDEDEEVEDDFEVEDIEVVPDYPEVTPNSKKKGDIAQNLSFFNHRDEEVTLGDYYKNRKLIWLIFSTYDCPGCNDQKYEIPKLNKVDYKERGFEVILIMNGMLSGPEPQNEPRKISTLREAMMMAHGASGDHTYGYLNHSHQATFRKFVNMGYPVNMFIDGNTMEILDHWEGWDPNGTSQLDRFIDFMLDEL